MAVIVGTNSYGSLAEADAYHSEGITGAAWDAYTDPQKEAGLVSATRILESGSYQGEKENPTQTLKFPRSGVVCGGIAVDPSETLESAKQAEFEYALILLQTPAVANSLVYGATNTKRLKAGSAEIEYFRPQEGTKYPPVILRLLGCYLSSSLSGLDGIGDTYASGTCDESTFDSDYSRVRGFD
ncbi:head-tail connector protein [Shewanella phage S0112]|nr:head-tail connector protein [Shewanella phage S0112]